MSISVNNKYKGVWPVMLTPFNQAGDIDAECYDRMLEWYINAGVSGIFALCGSSEMYHLNEDERIFLVKRAVVQCKGRIPVVATASLSNDLEDDLQRAAQLDDLGVNAIVLIPPDFCENDEQIEQYFMRMADSVKCDVGIYEMPLRENNQLSIELIKKLAASGKYSFVKETSCRLDTIRKKIEVCANSPLGILQANTHILLDSAQYGAMGIMGIAVNILPALAVKIWHGNYDTPEIRDAHALLCLVDSLLSHGYPATAKYMLQKIGFNILLKTRVNDIELSESTKKLIDCGLGYILEHCNE